MIKKFIYSTILVSLLFLLFWKFGFYDSKVVKVDNFIFEKPFLYRNISSKIDEKLSDSGFIMFSFLGVIVNDIYMYKITKENNIPKFQLKLKYVTKLENIDFANCYIVNDNIKIDEKTVMENIEIYNYPYSISFNKVNNEQKENVINQICDENNIVNIDLTLHPTLHPSD